MRKQWISFWTNPSWHMAMRSLSWWSLLSLPKCYLPAPWESMGQEPFHQLTAPGASITVRTHDPETSPLTSYQKIKILAECRLHCEDYLRYVQSTFCLLWSQYRKLDFSSTWGVVLQAFPHVLARGGVTGRCLTSEKSHTPWCDSQAMKASPLAMRLRETLWHYNSTDSLNDDHGSV